MLGLCWFGAGWIVGSAGVFESMMTVLLSSFVTILTSLSRSAIRTNGTIETGGIYYVISRALEAAIGW